MNDPHIQYLFQQFRAKQPMGSKSSSPHVANMEEHPFFDPSLPLEEDVRVSQPL